jgi:RHS repeat-associated protein
MGSTGERGRFWRLAVFIVLVLAMLIGIAPSVEAQGSSPSGEATEGGEQSTESAGEFGALSAGDLGEPVDVEDVPPLDSNQPVELAPSVPSGSFSAPPPTEDGQPWGNASEGPVDGAIPEGAEVLEELTTPTRLVYSTDDGSYTAVASAQPVRYEQSPGEWTDIDLELEERPSGDIAAASTPVEVVLPAEEPGSVEVGSERGPITISAPDVLEDPQADPELRGTVATVEDEDVAVMIEPQSWGVEQSLVVDDPSDPAAYEVEVELPAGVTARDSDRGIDFVDPGGELVGFFVGGLAEESSDDPSTASEASVEVELQSLEGGIATIEVSTDPEWLADPDREFPVVIDPGLATHDPDTATGGADTWVQSNLTAPLWTNDSLKLGEKPPAGTQLARSFLRFDLPSDLGPDNVVVDQAELRLDREVPATCTASNIEVGIIDEPFGASTTWSNQPSIGWSQGVADGHCEGDTVVLDVTETVWNSYNQLVVPDYGYALTAASETATSQWKESASGETTTGEPPQLVVQYDVTFPGKPDLVEPADEATVATITPTLVATEEPDADGDPTRYWFRAWTGATDTPSGQIVDSGWITPPAGTAPSWEIPEGELIDGSVYRWSVAATDGYHYPISSEPREFTVDLRLGTEGPSGHQEVGPVSVNLATGNATTSFTGPTYTTLAGDIGVELAYNSTTPELTGLTGKYINDWDEDREIDSGSEGVVVSRTDPAISFDWGTDSPQPGIQEDDFIVRWRGTITVPDDGTYRFGGNHDGGMRIAVTEDYLSTPNGADWNALGGPNSTPSAWTTATAANDPDWGPQLTGLDAGTEYHIVVDHFDGGGNALVDLRVEHPSSEQYVVPSSWLRPELPPHEALPRGWTMATPLGANVLTEVRISNNVASFRTFRGAWCCAFLRKGDGWEPAPGTQGELRRSADGRLTLQLSDGITYVFNAQGQIETATAPYVADQQASMRATYGAVNGRYPRLMQLEEPASGREIEFFYGERDPEDEFDGDCPTPSITLGNGKAPEGALCKVRFWDGREVRLNYDEEGQLARIWGAGWERADFGYTDGLLTAIRSPLATEYLAAFPETSAESLETHIEYTPGGPRGQVASVEQPVPTPGAPRPQTSFVYPSAVGGGPTYAHVAGAAEPAPVSASRTVIHDTAGRLTSDGGSDGLVSTMTWADDRVVSETDAAGFRTNTVYDGRDLPVEEWGPAPASSFTATPGDPESGLGAPLPAHAAEVPHRVMEYDQESNGAEMTGLAATWWTNQELAGSPDAFSKRTPFVDWNGSGPEELGYRSDDFSVRFSGILEVPQEGRWDFQAIRDGRVRVFIDDDLVIDEWEPSTATAGATAFDLTAGDHRITVEYAEGTGDAEIMLQWRRRTSTSPDEYEPWWDILGQRYAPNFGNLVLDDGPDPEEETRYHYGNQPWRGRATRTTVDSEGPGSLALLTKTHYEGNGFARQDGLERPSGEGVSVRYYGESDIDGESGVDTSRDNPCIAEDDPVHQGDQIGLVIGPDPAGDDGSLVKEFIYDEVGRRVAERTYEDGHDDGVPWDCFNFDARGRPTATVYARGTQDERSISYEYALDGNPLVFGTCDSDAPNATNCDPVSTMTELDQLGRVVQHGDTWGNLTTTSYDQVGNEVSSIGPGGVVARTYDEHGRLSSVAHDGAIMAEVAYDPATGNMARVDYPDGPGEAGNGTSLDQITYDEVHGQVSGVRYTNGPDAGDVITETSRTYDIAGNVATEQIDGLSASYQYDGASRLVSATIGTHSYTYDFTSSPLSCGVATAGANTNRMSSTADGVTTEYCYDEADRLIRAEQSGPDPEDEQVYEPEYDDQGNVVALADMDLEYDGSGRHVATADADSRVELRRNLDGHVVERRAEEDGEDDSTVRYAVGPNDVSVTQDESGALTSISIMLPGGVSVSLGATEDVWTYPNIRGVSTATTNERGEVDPEGHTHYDPYGNVIEEESGDPDDEPEDLQGAWPGGVVSEESFSIDLSELGARVYSPLLGRFLQPDPILEGSANDYEYGAGDPINNVDDAGTACRGGGSPRYVWAYSPRLGRRALYGSCKGRGVHGPIHPRYGEFKCRLAGGSCKTIYRSASNGGSFGCGLSCQAAAIARALWQQAIEYAQEMWRSAFEFATALTWQQAAAYSRALTDEALAQVTNITQLLFEGAISPQVAGILFASILFGAVMTTDPADVPPPRDGPGIFEAGGFTVSESAGGSSPTTCTRGDQIGGNPIALPSGEFWHRFDTFSFPSRGQPIQLSHSYSSEHAEDDGPLGHGWSLSYATIGIDEDQSSGVVTLTEENGTTLTFHPDLEEPGDYTSGTPRCMAELHEESDGSWTFTRLRQQQVLSFDEGGRLVSIAPLVGDTDAATTLSYDDGRLDEVTDDEGRTLSFEWDGDHVVEVSDSSTSVRTIEFDYDDDELVSWTDVGGGTWYFTYDDDHRVLTMQDPGQEGEASPHAVENTYDDRGRVVRQSDQLDREYLFDYETLGDRVLVTEPDGTLVAKRYLSGVLTSEWRGYGTPSEVTDRLYYDENTGQTRSSRDPLGRWAVSTFDEDGNQTSHTDQLGRTTTAEFNDRAQVIAATTAAGNAAGADPEDHTTTYVYDGDGVLLTTTTPIAGTTDELVVEYHHDDVDHPADITSMTDPDGEVWLYVYDDDGNQTSVEDPLGNLATLEHDYAGRVTAQVDPRGNESGADPTDYTTTTTYNAHGDVLTVDGPLSGDTTTNVYDANRNLTSTENANGHSSTYDYDAENQQTATHRADGSMTSTSHDPMGRVLTQTDAAGEVTSYSYDGLGNLEATTDPLGRTTSFRYDELGNVVQQQDPGGDCDAQPATGCRTSTYDAAGQVTAADFADPATPDLVGIDYDVMGREIRREDADGSIVERSYDSLGRLITSSDDNGAMSYTWNLMGKQTSITYPDSATVTQTFDEAGRLETSVFGGQTTTFGYDAGNNLTTIDFPGNQIDTYEYDRAGRMASADFGAGSTTNATIDPDRDVLGQVTSEAQSGLPGPSSHTWGYDQRERLVEEDANVTWAYDTADNLAQTSFADTQGFDEANQICFSSPASSGTCASPPADATTYEHDQRGNLSRYEPPAGSALDLTYDQANRLQSMGSVANYDYAPDSLRSKRTDSATTTFLWNRSGELPMLAAETTGATTTHFLYGPGGQPYAQVAGTTVTYLHHDHLGSTRLLTDSTGSVTGSAAYDAYGQPTAATGTQSRFGFAGEYIDPGTFLMYVRARYYSPSIGQFISVDPLYSDTLSRYGYAGSNPINNADPTGLFCITGTNPNGSCRGSHWVGDRAGNVASVGSSVGDWTVAHRHEIIDFAIVMGAAAATAAFCVATVGVGCAVVVAVGATAVGFGAHVGSDQIFQDENAISWQSALGRSALSAGMGSACALMLGQGCAGGLGGLGNGVGRANAPWFARGALRTGFAAQFGRPVVVPFYASLFIARGAGRQVLSEMYPC